MTTPQFYNTTPNLLFAASGADPIAGFGLVVVLLLIVLFWLISITCLICAAFSSRKSTKYCDSLYLSLTCSSLAIAGTIYFTWMTFDADMIDLSWAILISVLFALTLSPVTIATFSLWRRSHKSKPKKLRPEDELSFYP